MDNFSDNIRNRKLKVFISSTFQDMQPEREELMKKIFPQLRKLCESRGVVWNEVDLRWGVSNEQAAEGKVLPICFNEIEDCRPFFIGLLGERYGWIPDSLPDELVEAHPWIAEISDRSVTELEILHGALNSPGPSEHCLFYFRDPGYFRTRPESEHHVILESEDTTGSEFKDLGEDRRKKLLDLKKRIRSSGFPVREDYSNAKELGQLVLQDMTNLIDKLFPESDERTQLENYDLEHISYAESRYRIYIGRDRYFERLDRHVVEKTLPLVITGDSGIGKSALLANWAVRFQETHPDTFIITHFIGATPYSSDWATMLQRIMGEFQHRFGIQYEIPNEPSQLIKSFTNWLHIVAMREKAVIILDALNKLEEPENTRRLEWLPVHIPDNIRLIVSSLPGLSLDELKNREWQFYEVEKLDRSERVKLIRNYLNQYSKSLDDDRSKRIVENDSTGNPLYLRSLLEELRLFGVHENLDRAIDYYSSSESIQVLYSKILRRLERDYETEWPGLVQDAMTFLWASRRGLTESELLDLLGAAGKPLPRMQWSQFYSAVRKLLITRSGLIGFSHDYVREAIGDRYLITPKTRQKVHLKLAEYFAARGKNPRTVNELSWQLAESESWGRLYDCLRDLKFFRIAWQENEFEVKRYWSRLERDYSINLPEAYETLFETAETPEDFETFIWISDLLLDTGNLRESGSIKKKLIEHYKNEGDRRKQAECMRGYGTVLWKQNEIESALEVFAEQDRICQEIGHIRGLQSSLGKQAVINFHLGNLDEAKVMLERQEKICMELNYIPDLIKCLNNQAEILRLRSEPQGAMTLHKRVERLSRETGNIWTLSISLGNQAIILCNAGEYDQAMILLKEQEKYAREISDPYGIERSIGSQALILREQGDLDGAMELHKKQESICREISHLNGLQISLGNQAEILIRRGQMDEAMALCKEGESICRNSKIQDGLAYSLTHQAQILINKKKINDAHKAAEEAKRLVDEYKFTWLSKEIEPILEKVKANERD
ncbi:MAG TPA: DUF4062 domain-containing protein [bacterium]